MRTFTYQKVATAIDAVRAIAASGDGTRFLAGGTTLYDLMKLNVEAPSRIVDINSLSELQAVDTSGSNELVFGALARMSDVAAEAAARTAGVAVLSRDGRPVLAAHRRAALADRRSRSQGAPTDHQPVQPVSAVRRPHGLWP